jgi:hypothetical protein
MATLEKLQQYGEDIISLSQILPDSYEYDGEEILISWYMLGIHHNVVYCYVDNLEEARSITRAFRGIWDKETDTANFMLSHKVLIRDIPWKIEINIPRDEVCEKIQVGTKMVEKINPEFTIPMITVEEPVYEWKCPEVILDAN